MTEEKRPTLEEVKAFIGKKKEETLEIDKSMIRLFCQCIGDTNPKWQDTAPPGLVTTAMISGGALAIEVPRPYKRSVAAGADWEFHKTIKPGDAITTTHEFAEVQDRSSEKGPRVLLIYKSTHRDQKGDVVAVSTNSIMSY